MVRCLKSTGYRTHDFVEDSGRMATKWQWHRNVPLNTRTLCSHALNVVKVSNALMFVG